MARQTPYDSFVQGFISSSKTIITWSGFISAVIYSLTAGVILAAMYFLMVPKEFWTPILIVYGIGAVAHIAAEGFMGVCAQIGATMEYWEARYGNSKKSEDVEAYVADLTDPEPK